MDLLKMLRRPPAIRDIAGLAQFVDEQAAFLVQKGIYEYSRARAGHYAKVLLAETSFLDAVERSRWQAYPLGLLMIAEMVEGVLSDGGHEVSHELAALVVSVCDRYAPPASLTEAEWHGVRQRLAERLGGIRRRPRKPVKDIPEPFAADYFALMPIHEKLRGRDFSTVHSYLKVTLCNIHDELLGRVELAALAAALRTDRRHGGAP